MSRFRLARPRIACRAISRPGIRRHRFDLLGNRRSAWNTAARSGCTVEAMEGAAVGLAVLRSSPETPFVELRVISNSTGPDQRWDLPYALDRLTDLASAL